MGECEPAIRDVKSVPLVNASLTIAVNARHSQISVNKIVPVTGVAKNGFLHHFRSRMWDGLVVDIWAHRDGHRADHAVRELLAKPPADREVLPRDRPAQRLLIWGTRDPPLRNDLDQPRACRRGTEDFLVVLGT